MIPICCILTKLFVCQLFLDRSPSMDEDAPRPRRASATAAQASVAALAASVTRVNRVHRCMITSWIFLRPSLLLVVVFPFQKRTASVGTALCEACVFGVPLSVDQDETAGTNSMDVTATVPEPRPPTPDGVATNVTAERFAAIRNDPMYARLQGKEDVVMCDRHKNDILKKTKRAKTASNSTAAAAISFLCVCGSKSEESRPIPFVFV